MSVQRGPAPTLEEVAAAAGVSRSTASRVINGSSLVSEAVVTAVNAAIDSLGYQPNRAARSLAKRQTMAIALIVPEETMRFFGDPYFAAVVDGITRGFADSDYVLNLQLAGPAATEKMVRYLKGGNVDGALVVSHHSGDSFLELLNRTVPIVYNGRPLGDARDSYFVDVDNAAGARKGAQHLVDLGRTAIGTVAGPADMPAGVDRAIGWASALDAAGLDASRVAHGDFSLAGGARAMRELLEAHPDLDAVFVASDLMAIGALTVLRERGIRVPADVAVVGFDDSPVATGGDIELTTVRQPSTEMGEEMARMLLALLRGESVEHTRIMETTIVVRDSA